MLCARFYTIFGRDNESICHFYREMKRREITRLIGKLEEENLLSMIGNDVVVVFGGLEKEKLNQCLQISISIFSKSSNNFPQLHRPQTPS
jgi:hypothetical protein